MDSYVISHRFFENVSRYADKDALLSKIDGHYRGLSYAELGERVRAIAMMLDSWGIRKGDKVAIMSDNREEWIMADLANQSIGAVSVPIYPTLTLAQIQVLFEHSEPRVILLSDEEMFTKAIESGTSFEKIVTFDTVEEAREAVVLSDMIEQGRQLLKEKPDRFAELLAGVKSEDLACINYTSGTTGVPKGVMLTHFNFVKDVDNSIQIIQIFPSDVFLSFLPLSHVLERMGGYYVPMILGATIGFAERVDTVLENMAEVRPTILVSVPRLFEKIYATVMSGVQAGSNLKKKIFYWALKSGKKRMDAILNNTRMGVWQKARVALADRLVFSKLHKKTGGRLERFISGGAPLSKEIAEFLFSAGLKIFEGYGLTETSPVITVNGPGKVRLGSVGVAIPETEFKIAEDGEILVRGPQIMQGYFKNEAMTKEVIDDQNYLHTGDIGHFDNDGFLYITDRKKNLIITAGGKNVSPQPIEEAIKLSQYIAQVVLIGDRRNFISALVTLDQEITGKWADRQGIPFENYADFVRKDEVRALIWQEIKKQIQAFSRFEQIKKFAILPKDLTIEDGELTPSLKVKRKAVLEKYADIVEDMYNE